MFQEFMTGKKSEHDDVPWQEIIQGAGFSQKTVSNLERFLGKSANDIVKKRPYALMAFPGFGFARADSIALSGGILPEDPIRQKAALSYILDREEDNGHVFSPFNPVLAEVSELTKVTKEIIVRNLDYFSEYSVDHGKISKRKTRDYEYRIFQSLKALDQNHIIFEVPDFPKDITRDQKSAFYNAFLSPISLIIGRPGTGKTKTIEAIYTEARKGPHQIAVAAPTGKAANRLKEKGIPALTLHRLLEWVVTDTMPQGFPTKTAQSPIQAQIVIVDESSMIPSSLLSMLLAAISPGNHIVLVGDPNQIPPIGPGCPFLDILNSGKYPTVNLKHIFRQAEGSQISLACEAIRENSPLDFYKAMRSKPEEAEFKIIKSDETFKDSILASIGNESEDEVQIITAQKETSSLFNLFLSEHFNPYRSPSATFSKDDKIIVLKNDYAKGVFNGDQGKVIEAGLLKGYEVYVGRKKVLIPYSRIVDLKGIKSKPKDVIFRGIRVRIGDLEALFSEKEFALLSLSYSITIHKAQGSEWPHVVLVLPDNTYREMKTRNLLYTAISRAKTKLTVIASHGTLSRCIENPMPPRRTILSTFFSEASQTT